MLADDVKDCVVVLELIDTNAGFRLQSWRFSARSVVEIGRSEECDVRLSNPYVSRRHATIQRRDGTWRLIAVGKHGVLLDDERVDTVQLVNYQVFRLGPGGPSLRFSLVDERTESVETLEESSSAPFSLVVDERKKEREVAEIADGRFFRELQKKARSLKARRSEPS